MNKKTEFYIFYILPIIAYCSLIFYISNQPNLTGIIGTQLISDKIKHAIAYLMLSILTYRAIRKTRYKKYSYTIAILFTIFYGITDEIHQSFIPGRVASFYDIIANSIGANLILIKKVGKHAQR